MARITLEYPEQVFTFTTSMTVRTGDINHGSHLGFDRLVSLLGHARFEYLATLGIDEHSNPAIIVGDLAVVYKAESFRQDELVFEVGVTDENRYGGDIVYRVTRPADGAVVAVAKTGVVFLDTTTKRPTTPPESFGQQVAR
ncbi:MAG: thioesterase family protein [Dermatophilus congolensis]|nr:thioesterase family protein [Dermatophilus congolensis]